MSWRDRIDTSDPRRVLAYEESERTEQRIIDAARQEGARQAAETERARQAEEAAADERRRTEAMSEAERRLALGEAIAAYDAAADAFRLAMLNVERARQRVDAADAELADYADLDARLVEFRVGQVKRNTDDALPGDLAQAQNDRAAVIDRLDASHKALARLQDEATEAQRAVDRAAEGRAVAATRVVLFYVDEAAAELAAADATAAALRQRLASIGATWIKHQGGVASLAALSPRARDALRNAPVPPEPDPTCQTRLRDLHARLLDDADTTLDGDD